MLLGVVLFPKDVPHLKKVGVGGVITLNEPYEILVQLYQVRHIPFPFLECLFFCILCAVGNMSNL